MTDCDRWMALEDRRAVGDPLPEADLSFCAEHVRGCADCRRESAFWQDLAGADLGPERSEAEATREEVDKVVAWYEERRQNPRGAEVAATAARLPARRKGLARGAALAGALALAAAALLFARRTREPEVVSAQGAHSTRARVASVSGGAAVDGRPARAGDAVLPGQTVRAGGRTCLDLELGVRTCLEAGSEASFADAQAAHRVVALRSGHLSAALAHQPAGTSFSVWTPMGTATAIGTAFSVDAPDPAGPVTVKVAKGIVAVTSGGSTVSVHAGEETVLGSSRVTASATGSDERIPAEPIDARSWENGAPALEPEPTPAAAIAPALPPPLRPATATSPVPEPRASADRTPRAPGAGELLERARGLRGDGRFRDAADAYRELEASHPRSPEAHASLVSLGEIELSHLGDPAGALRLFDQYLETGGVLAEEAEYDRIRALGALGRVTEERRAIDEFLSRYPSSVHARGLQERTPLP